MDTQTTGLVWTIAILAFTSALTSAVAYTLGRFYEFKAKSEQMSQLTLLASLWALGEANGLKKSTVIQRIIEKYNTGGPSDAAKLQNMDDMIEGLSGFDELMPKKRHDVLMDTYDFDQEADEHPEDLV